MQPGLGNSLESGDMILSVNGERVHGAAALEVKMGQLPSDETILLVVMREGAEIKLRYSSVESDGKDSDI